MPNKKILVLVPTWISYKCLKPYIIGLKLRGYDFQILTQKSMFYSITEEIEFDSSKLIDIEILKKYWLRRYIYAALLFLLVPSDFSNYWP